MNTVTKLTLMDKSRLLSEKIENLFFVRVVREGLVSMIPVLTIGAFALLLKSFPLYSYQLLINSFAGGFLYNIFNMMYQATFGLLSYYMVLSFCMSFFTLKDPDEGVNIWAIASALACHSITVGTWSSSFTFSDLGPKSSFLAIITTFVSSEIFWNISKRLNREKIMAISGTDFRLGSTLFALIPSTMTIAFVAFVAFIVSLSGYDTIHILITAGLVSAFDIIDNLFVKGLFFIFVQSFLWLFGIHGGNTLEGVTQTIFNPLMGENLSAVATNVLPDQILCKPFFDCFILMGGCGSSICLFIAIILFAKNKGMRTIAQTAGPALLFNINELLVFGLPIVFNPVMAIPFLLVPVLQYLVAYFAIAIGLVPHIISAVEWTTPVFISGFAATGSVRGCVLQLVNIAIGVFVYMPFVKLMERIKDDREEEHKEAFIKWYKEKEESLVQTSLTTLSGLYGDIAKEWRLSSKKL